jgi:hypothetical protein
MPRPALPPSPASLRRPRCPPPAPQALLKSNHTLFARVANASGLVPALNSTALRATVFVPSDEAIKKAAAAFKVTPEELLANQLLVDRIAGG